MPRFLVLRPSSGRGGGGGGGETDWLTRNFVTHVIVEKSASFSVVIREGAEKGGGGGGGGGKMR